jgi:hypothetical protein
VACDNHNYPLLSSTARYLPEFTKSITPQYLLHRLEDPSSPLVNLVPVAAVPGTLNWRSKLSQSDVDSPLDKLQVHGSCSMSLVSPQLSFTNSLLSSTEINDRLSPDNTEATLSTLLGAFANAHPRHSMDRGEAEFSQTGLPTPYPHAFTEPQSEDSPADQSSAHQYTPQPEVVRSNNFSASATPTSEYGVYPASARSGSFPEHVHRQYHPGSNHSGSSGGMAQPTSPSLPLQDARSNNPQIKSDQDVPIDPSIAASSPTYPAQHGQYSPYPPQQEMQHGYPSHPGGAMYAQPRPDWAGYGGHPQHGLPGYPVSGAQTPTSAAPAGGRPGQVRMLVLYNP